MFPHNMRFSALAYMFFSLHYPRPVRERLLVVYRFLPKRDHRSTCYFERAWYVPPIATNRKTTFVFLSCTQSQGIFLTGRTVNLYKSYAKHTIDFAPNFYFRLHCLLIVNMSEMFIYRSLPMQLQLTCDN